MAASNLGVVFGPTLLRSKEETMAAIMSLKYQSIVVELMVNEYEQVINVFCFTTLTACFAQPVFSQCCDKLMKPSFPFKAVRIAELFKLI